MIAVYLRNRAGEELAVAEADSPEGAMLAGQTLFDDHLAAHPYQGVAKSLSVSFYTDGVLACSCDGRPR